MKYPLEKYRFYTDGTNKVIAVSTYAGKFVRGSAKCAPGDKFNPEIGQQLAAARCNEKIAKKRYERAVIKYKEAVQEAAAAVDYATKMKEYVNNSYIEYNTASQEVDIMEDVLKGQS